MADLAKAVFLDRDGVLIGLVNASERNGEQGAALWADDVLLEEGAAAALRLLRDEGWKLAVVSNQPDAAKRHATMTDLASVHHKFLALLKAEGASVDAWRYCFHHPLGDSLWSRECDCRKPAPGMLYSLGYEIGVLLRDSWMVGDSDVDILAGQASGCRTALIENPVTAHRRVLGVQPTIRAPSLLEAAKMITSFG